MVDAVPPSPEEPSKLNMDVNLAGALCYLFVCLSGLVFFLLETENKRIRFHALQSLVLFSSLWVAQLACIVLAIFGGGFFLWDVLNSVLGLAQFVLWLVLVIKTYHGDTIKMPVIGDFAARTVGWTS
jgi:uncharacterized membrane protein